MIDGNVKVRQRHLGGSFAVVVAVQIFDFASAKSDVFILLFVSIHP